MLHWQLPACIINCWSHELVFKHPPASAFKMGTFSKLVDLRVGPPERFYSNVCSLSLFLCITLIHHRHILKSRQVIQIFSSPDMSSYWRKYLTNDLVCALSGHVFTADVISVITNDATNYYYNKRCVILFVLPSVCPFEAQVRGYNKILFSTSLNTRH